jgi:hypothetical protein
MRIAVLGPLQVRANNSAPVDVPGARLRLLLGVLVAAAPAPVAEHRLIESLASADSPPLDVETLRTEVRRLRGALEPGLPDRSSGQYVLHRGSGYALAVARGDVDALRFADLAARGRAQLASGDADDAVRLLATALGLWAGEPYGDWPEADFAAAERHRLEGIRAGAEADLAQAREALARRPQQSTPAPPLPERRPPVVVLEVEEPAEPSLPPVDPPQDDVLTSVPADVPARRPRRSPLLVGALVLAVAVPFVAARVSAGHQRSADQSATVADADQLAGLSVMATPLDVSLLLAAEAYRLADTPDTRQALAAAVDGHARVERTVSFSGGSPQDAVLSGGTVTFAVGLSVVGWSISPTTLPGVIMDIPREWGAWVVAAPSPVRGVLMGAGIGRSGPWLRMVSTLDGTSRLLLEGDRVGGRPVDGAVDPEGRRLALVVARPDDAEPDDASRWHLLDVDAVDGTLRDTGMAGTLPVPVEGVRADFADYSDSFVVWDDYPVPTATLVQPADGTLTPIAPSRRTAGVIGFRATSTGAAELWDDGVITLVDRSGQTVQLVHAHHGMVADIAVSPDGRWAVSAGERGQIFRWDVDPATGLWSRPEPLAGHTGDVVGVEIDASGTRLASVATDHSIISWDMRPDGGRATAGPADRLAAACAMVARDLTPAEWRQYLPDRPWRATCSDLQ